MSGSEAEVFLTLSFLTVIAGVLIIVLGLRHRLKIIEMVHRERLAMIDKGIVPPPDRGAAAIFHAIGSRGHRPAASSRQLSFGIGLVGWGIGLAMLLGFAFDAPAAGVGIGGGISVLGAAAIVSAILTREGPPASSAMPPEPPSAPPAPPANGDRL